MGNAAAAEQIDTLDSGLEMIPTLLSTMYLLYFGLALLCHTALARQPLTYAPTPNGTYVPPRNANVTTVLDVLTSRDDCKILVEKIRSTAGWSAPST